MLCGTAAAHAADAVTPAYPARPVRIVVAFAPGGIADTIARSVGQKLAERYAQTVVIDNRPGAGGILASRIVTNATPDGHTLLVHTSAAAINVSLAKEFVHPVTELTPLANAASTPTIIVAHRSAATKGLLDFVRGAKSGRVTYSTAGVGTSQHLAGEYLFKAVPGLQATHVAYAGGSTPIIALLGQQIDLSVTTVPTALAQVKAGNLRAYATVTRKRLVLLPDVPTIAEAGFADFEDRSWIAFFAPHKLAPAMATRLNADINSVLATADIKDRLAAIGLDAQITTQPEFAEYLTGEVAKWARVVKTIGLAPN